MSEYVDLFHKKLPHAPPEQEVFEELESLCKSPGFVHVIASFCRHLIVGSTMFKHRLQKKLSRFKSKAIFPPS